MIKITEKQQEVLDMLKLGMSNKEIAYHMGVKEPTVKMHLTALFKKFKVKNRVQLLIKSTTRKSFQPFVLTPISGKVEFPKHLFMPSDEVWKWLAKDDKNG